MARTLPFLCIAAALAASTCALADEAEGNNRASTVVIGSSFVRSIQDTGSYGNGASIATVTRQANRDWKGQTVGAWHSTVGPTVLIHPVHGAFHAFVNGDKPVVTFEPAASWQWPLKVGKSWTRNVTMTVHATDQVIPVETQITVEAYEDVTMPAGTFKAWRVRTVDNLGNEDVQWFSSDLTVFIKQKLTRTDKHAAGPGVRETELVSQSIRHQ
ncbi:MAG TPA: hypothetical protein VF522_11640 [Ramlibacter sp.]|uniref:hypothetical protein n=1 Tax=Ramlibacter sp. TaxID=1917967 RepID=UPI002ED5E1AB